MTNPKGPRRIRYEIDESRNRKPVDSSALPIRATMISVSAKNAYEGRHSHYRAAALQCLYERETSSHLPSQVMVQRFHSLQQAGIPVSAEGRKYVRRLVAGVVENQAALDACIAQVARRFPVETLSFIDRNILRLALCEVEHEKFDTPVKVVIAEAIRLAECYGSAISPRFVHGVLGAALKARVAAEAPAKVS